MAVFPPVVEAFIELCSRPDDEGRFLPTETAWEMATRANPDLVASQTFSQVWAQDAVRDEVRKRRRLCAVDFFARRLPLHKLVAKIDDLLNACNKDGSANHSARAKGLEMALQLQMMHPGSGDKFVTQEIQHTTLVVGEPKV